MLEAFYEDIAELRRREGLINGAVDDLAMLMRRKLATSEIDEYRELKEVYDKLKKVLLGEKNAGEYDR